MYHPVPTPYFLQDGTSQFSHLFLHSLPDEAYFPSNGELISTPLAEPETPIDNIGQPLNPQERDRPLPAHSKPPGTDDLTTAPTFIQRALASPLRRGSVAAPPGLQPSPNSPDGGGADPPDPGRRFHRFSTGVAAGTSPPGQATPAGLRGPPARSRDASPIRGLRGLAGLSPLSPQQQGQGPPEEEWSRSVRPLPRRRPRPELASSSS